MLFNSHLFLFVFFPAVLAFYSVVSRYGRTAALSTLLVASLFFYAWWDVRFLPLLGLSILGNYAIGVMMTRAASRERDGTVRILLTLGVTLNLLVLGFFKYTNFFVKTLDAAAGTNIFVAHIILPLGISFFTFEQIGYLIDIRRGHVYRP